MLSLIEIELEIDVRFRFVIVVFDGVVSRVIALSCPDIVTSLSSAVFIFYD